MSEWRRWQKCKFPLSKQYVSHGGLIYNLPRWLCVSRLTQGGCCPFRVETPTIKAGNQCHRKARLHIKIMWAWRTTSKAGASPRTEPPPRPARDPPTHTHPKPPRTTVSLDVLSHGPAAEIGLRSLFPLRNSTSIRHSRILEPAKKADGSLLPCRTDCSIVKNISWEMVQSTKRLQPRWVAGKTCLSCHLIPLLFSSVAKQRKKS